MKLHSVANCVLLGLVLALYLTNWNSSGKWKSTSFKWTNLLFLHHTSMICLGYSFSFVVFLKTLEHIQALKQLDFFLKVVFKVRAGQDTVCVRTGRWGEYFSVFLSICCCTVVKHTVLPPYSCPAFQSVVWQCGRTSRNTKVVQSLCDHSVGVVLFWCHFNKDKVGNISEACP